MSGKSQPLNAKDAASFQRALTLYEKREYEKSLVELEAVLKRRKERLHGESLCLKGLLLFHIDKANAAESQRLITEGTQVDSQSHVAWHMAGIFYKLQHDYAKAYRAYTNSYRLNKENPNVYQDLAMLAAQQRDFPFLVEVRRRALSHKMSVRMAWSALLAAQFLARQYEDLEKTGELYERVLAVDASARTAPIKQDELIEESELLMLRNRAIQLQNAPQRALENLRTIEPRVRDRLAWLEAEAELLAELGSPEAVEKYRALVERNPDCLEYLVALEKLVGGDIDAHYAQLEQQLRHALVPKLRRLELLQNTPAFADVFLTFVRGQLARGVLTVFVLVEPLYSDPKVPALVDANVDSLTSSDETVALAKLVFLASHYSQTGRHTQALELLEQTPAPTDPDTSADFSLAYARVLGRAGDFAASARVLHAAAAALPNDVLLNARAGEAALHALDVESGYAHAFAFAYSGKHVKTDAEAIKHLVSIESVNVVLAMARAHARRQEHGLALKRALQATGIFDAYQREQYDFHFFGPRKGTLRQYISLVEWEDRVYDNPVYAEAAEIAVREWIAFHAPYTDVTSEAKETAAKNWRKKQLDKLDLKADNDPFGIAALEAKDGLARALELLQPLKQARPTDAGVALLEFEVYAAQKKYVLAAQCLKRAKASGATRSQIAAGGVVLRHTLDTDDHASPAIRSVQMKLLPTIADEGDIVNDALVDYCNTHVTDLLDWLKTRRIINTVDSKAVNSASERVRELSDAESVDAAVRELRRSGADTAQFTDAVRKLWPRASFLDI